MKWHIDLMNQKRIILASDLHYHNPYQPIADGKNLVYDYGESMDERMACFCELVEYERSCADIDAILFLGDMGHDSADNLASFQFAYRKKVSVPTYFLPGNHEGFPEGEWCRLTGCRRQYIIDIGNIRFLMADNFRDLQHPHHLQPMDMDFLNQNLPADGKFMILCSHYFPVTPELEAWATDRKQLLCFFHGHSHDADPLIQTVGGKPVFSTGNFSYGLNMKDRQDWVRKWGWSVTEITVNSDSVRIQRVFPCVDYRFSDLVYPNRFSGEVVDTYHSDIQALAVATLEL